jgi:hypothetical protein
VSRRFEAVLSFWDLLSTVQYVDLKTTPVPLEDVVRIYADDLFDMWLETRSGEVRVDLGAALARMQSAPEDEIRSRLIARMLRLVQMESAIKNKNRLRDHALLEDALAKLEGTQYEGLKAGTNDLITLLCSIDRTLPPT